MLIYIDEFFLKMCTKLMGKVSKIKGIRSRRRLHICKWAFLQVPSLILWFQSTWPLIMQIVKIKSNLVTIKVEDIKQKSLL